MTCFEKFKMDHPEYSEFDLGWETRDSCPDEFGYVKSLGDYCDSNCRDCWNQEIPETTGNLIIGDSEIEHPNTDLPRILDSGARREFESGAVRDIHEGKGRCDLLPLDVVAEYLCDSVIEDINRFQESGQTRWLYSAIKEFLDNFDSCPFTMLLEVAIHFEEGAKKYDDNNWRKGIDVRCYIDSAVRHYLKFQRGDKDEPHHRAFVWNLFCAIWTCKHKPELNDYRKEGSDYVAYICDGKQCESCSDECNHTLDIHHAKNFSRHIHDDREGWWENAEIKLGKGGDN